MFKSSYLLHQIIDTLYVSLSGSEKYIQMQIFGQKLLIFNFLLTQFFEFHIYLVL